MSIPPSPRLGRPVGSAVIVLAGIGCANSPTNPTLATASGWTLPGNGRQHHAVAACNRGSDCVIARQTGAFSTAVVPLSPDGVLGDNVQLLDAPGGWNHPSLAARESCETEFHLVVAGNGSPGSTGVRVDGSFDAPTPLDPNADTWGFWPDVAASPTGALAVWSTKTELWQAHFSDPCKPGAADVAPWPIALPQGTADPPAVTATSDGFVRAWTEQNGFNWQLMAQPLDAQGQPLAEPWPVAFGSDGSLGTRPQLATLPNAEGTVALTWRMNPADGTEQGAYLTWLGPEGPTLTVRLDSGTGDRPFPLAWEGGVWVAWEEGFPRQVRVASVQPHTDRIEPLCDGIGDPQANSGRPYLAERGDEALLIWEDVYSTGEPISDSDVRLTLVNTFGC